MGAQKTFDLTLTTIKGDQNVTFLSIDRDEQKALVEYFKRSNIKVRAAGPQPSNTQYRVPTIKEELSSSFEFREASLSSFQEHQRKTKTERNNFPRTQTVSISGLEIC